MGRSGAKRTTSAAVSGAVALLVSVLSLATAGPVGAAADVTREYWMDVETQFFHHANDRISPSAVGCEPAGSRYHYLTQWRVDDTSPAAGSGTVSSSCQVAWMDQDTGQARANSGGSTRLRWDDKHDAITDAFVSTHLVGTAAAAGGAQTATVTGLYYLKPVTLGGTLPVWIRGTGTASNAGSGTFSSRFFIWRQADNRITTAYQRNQVGTSTVLDDHVFLDGGEYLIGMMVVPKYGSGEAQGAAGSASATWDVTVEVECDIVGTADADTLVGTGKDETLCGLEGDDRILGGGGNDVIFGGAGADQINGGPGRDEIFGDEGADVLIGDGAGLAPCPADAGGGDDEIFGGNGADRIHGCGGNDVAEGNAGADFIAGGRGSDWLEGGGGVDTIRGHRGDDVIDAGAGHDGTGSGGPVDGGPGADDIDGRGGDDQLAGGGGDDTVNGGSGRDKLLGDAGNDVLVGGGHKDVLKGGDGNDTIKARDGVKDVVRGGGGNADRARVDGADDVSGVEVRL